MQSNNDEVNPAIVDRAYEDSPIEAGIVVIETILYLT